MSNKSIFLVIIAALGLILQSCRDNSNENTEDDVNKYIDI